MRVLIVAKTRRGGGACVGGIARDGRSVRLVAADAASNERAGLEYEVGEVWEMDLGPDPGIVPPHIENMIVRRARRLSRVAQPETIIRRLMPPVTGSPERLFDGRLQHLTSGALYIAERTGLPSRSTMFWVPDRPLRRDVEGKRIRYRYPTADGGRTLTYVGFQEPLEAIPAGTLVRVSLAHWWRPKEQPDEELRCHAQLSGWFLTPSEGGAIPDRGPAMPEARATGRASVPARADASADAELTGAREVLRRTFGYADFLPLQATIVRRLLARQDTLAIMPTGGGKSLCYQLPALLFEGLTVVVSPLIALMQDQVSQLHELGVGAAFLNSTLTHGEYVAVARRVRGGEVRLLYLAPETLLRPESLVLLEQSRLACLAVDEAHCISEWGHDFRPEYRQLEAVRRRFPGAVGVALTATATPRVREDIRRLLGIPAAGEFVASFNRPNLFLAARPRRDGLPQTVAFLEPHRGQSGIIYCSTRKQVDALAEGLRARGWPVWAYHAGLEAAVRRRHQDEFIREDAGVMVATVAFGMGINKSNVRFVLHYHLPRDLESYYQEIGRAGRDGLPADCLLLHSRADAVTMRRFIEAGAASERAGRERRLEAIMRYAETTGCRRELLLAYFGEECASACGQCDRCRDRRAGPEAGRTDVTDAAWKFLTCVQDTGQLYGLAHVIAVLRGSHSQRVQKAGHDRLASHGSGRDLDLERWQALGGQLLEQGLVTQGLEFGGLRLTAPGRAVLRGERVYARQLVQADPEAKVGGGAGAGTGVGAGVGVGIGVGGPAVRGASDARLFEALRKLRRTWADAAGVPAYLVFSDRTLQELAVQRPQTREGLLAIHGVGEVKRAKYGDLLLEAIRAHGGSGTG